MQSPIMCNGFHIRPLRQADREGVAALFARLSPDSLFQRFHSAGVRVVDAVLDQVTAGHVLIAEADGSLVGLASYHRGRHRGDAELAIVVDDANQRRGVGTALCKCLSRDAQDAGIQQLRADLLPTNQAMLGVLRALNLPMHHVSMRDVVQVTLDLRPQWLTCAGRETVSA